MPERYIIHNDCKLWACGEGKGLPVIFCNGGPGCDDYLGDVSKMIEDFCRVVRFEPRGCGRSDYDGNYDLTTLIEDIEHIRIHYKFEQVLLIGHSFGPDIALAYGLAYPKHVSGIIGIAGGRIVNDRHWSETYHRNLKELGEINVKEFVADPRVNPECNASWRDYIKRPNLLADISAIEFPVTFIGAGSDIRPNWPARQLAALIPQGEYTEIAGAPHSIWLTHPEALAVELRCAINRVIQDAC